MRRKPSGGIRKRGAIWWIFYRVGGKQFDESAGSRDERAARALLAQRRREIREGTWTPPSSNAAQGEAERLRARLAELESAAANGPLTVAVYAERWFERRRLAEVASAHDEENRIRTWVLPRIGEHALTDVKRSDVRDLIAEMMRATSPTTGKPYAARSVLHVYGALRVMFGDAVHDELIAATPCTLRVRKGELPAKRDADPRWRAESVYTRDECEMLISDERIAWDRRVLYSMMILGGLRSAEATGRRWRDYDPAAQPLGRLVVATQARSDMPEKRTKTGSAAEVPVHPTLAAILAEWRLRGFAFFFSRHPQPEDLIVPSRADGRSPRSKTLLTRLKEDLEALGLRSKGRGRHSMRASFLSLGEIDGANPAILRRVTHAPPADVASGYVRIGWPSLCAEVAKLRVERRVANVVPLRRAANADSGADSPTAETKEPPFCGGFSSISERDGRDSNRIVSPESHHIFAKDTNGSLSADPEISGRGEHRLQSLTQSLTVRLERAERLLREAGHADEAEAVAAALRKLR